MFKKELAQIFFNDINRRIAEIRIEKGLSQANVAETMGVYLRDYQRWETGRVLTLWTLYRFTVVFDRPPSEFFKKPKTEKPGRGRPRRKDLLLNRDLSFSTIFEILLG
jgi:transcriptional regulator with XRE-family HTH domain